MVEAKDKATGPAEVKRATTTAAKKADVAKEATDDAADKAAESKRQDDKEKAAREERLKRADDSEKMETRPRHVGMTTGLAYNPDYTVEDELRAQWPNLEPGDEKPSDKKD